MNDWSWLLVHSSWQPIFQSNITIRHCEYVALCKTTSLQNNHFWNACLAFWSPMSNLLKKITLYLWLIDMK